MTTLKRADLRRLGNSASGIVTEAAGRLLEQTLTFVVEEYIRPRDAEIERLKARIVELENSK